MLTLTVDELRDLTGHRRCDAQRRELEHMRIPFHERRDGSLAVLRIHVEGKAASTIPEEREPELLP